MSTSTLQDRVKLALQVSGKTKTDLWKGCGVSSGTVTTWVKGPNQTISGVNLMKAATILGVNPDWLATGNGEMQSKPTAHDTELQVLSLGLTPIGPDYPFSSIKMNLDWLQSSIVNASIDDLSLILVSDDAMSPTLNRRDLLLIDRSANTFKNDGIYLISTPAGNFLKRLNKNLDGSLTVKSDNPSYTQETVYSLTQSGISISGKAILTWSEKVLK